MLHSETYSNPFEPFSLTYLMIEISKLSKNYGHVQALKSASFSVRKGEVVGLLGPNGAGKTTLMKIMTGFLGPDSGKAVIDGNNIVKESLLVQKVIGYLPENAPLYPELSVQSYLKMIAELRCIPKSNQPALLSKAIRNIGLENHLIIVKPFENKMKARDYYNTLFANQTITKELKNTAHKTYIISDENFIYFYKNKDLKGYTNFFKKKYKIDTD